MSRIAVALCFGVLFLGLSGCGKGNIFGSAHKSGSSSDTTALSADAYTAFRNKDYAKAKEYYKKILDADPSNSEAIYGYSAATLADSGLSISAIVSNLIQQKNAPALKHLSPTLSAVGRSSSLSTNILPQSVIDNLSKIRTAVNRVLQSDLLPKIIKGRADGNIAPDNADLNINTALCLILRAATNLQDAGVLVINSDYTVASIKPGLTAADKQIIIDASKDIASAFFRLKVVYEKLKLGDDSNISNIKKDINALLDNLKADPALAGVVLADINTDYL